MQTYKATTKHKPMTWESLAEEFNTQAGVKKIVNN